MGRSRKPLWSFGPPRVRIPPSPLAVKARQLQAHMNSKALSSWFSLVAIILILWGAVFTVFGLGILPVDRDVLLEWETALYGAIMTGWGVTLLLAGRRHAFQRKTAT